MEALKIHRLWVVLFVLAWAAAGRPVSASQPEGHAEISRPTAGDSVSGVVTILGSASSPTFSEYELSFGYDPNPTDTWFPIGEPVAAQVSFGRLGLWDTTEITDGKYSLRLTVFLDDGGLVQDVVGAISVRNTLNGEAPPAAGSPGPSPTERAAQAPAAGLSTSSSAVTATTEAPPVARPGRSRQIEVGQIILIGGMTSILTMFTLGAYVYVRSNLRQRWGAIRARRIHTRVDVDGPRPGGDT
ncbi:MAG: hypothetical protein A2Z37_10760 [Chloroflexi bacterium RBG_19FT_COMBO_62_14]|nr:MAG: hypothetical protein A2Z37_10760 [Chloroflexi bacterium RBG_19FT_COMBO_62_14]